MDEREAERMKKAQDQNTTTKNEHLLMKRNVAFYTFDFRLEKPLKVVLKGILHEVTEDLETRSYKV